MSEYCETESFVASCSSPDEMVVMQTAHFGRMRLGRCLTVNNGNLGCQLDVLDQLDRLCSGRRRCSVVVATVDHRALPCTREVRGYLEASYRCVKGLRPSLCSRRSLPSRRPDTSRTCLTVGATQFTPPPHQTPQNSPVCVVSGLAV